VRRIEVLSLDPLKALMPRNDRNIGVPSNDIRPNVKVDVYIDSELIGSRIESAVTSALGLLGSSADTDGRAKHMPAQR
jgi:hypothetical protein